MGELSSHKNLSIIKYTSIRVRDDLIDWKLLNKISTCPKSYNSENLIIWIKSQWCVKKFFRVQWGLLYDYYDTLARRVGSISLYLRADSPSLKMSSKFSPWLWYSYSWRLMIDKGWGSLGWPKVFWWSYIDCKTICWLNELA